MTKYLVTENNALQYAETGNKCLTLFSRIGGMRDSTEAKILYYFMEAYDENPELATLILFWARAARKGSGERQTFHQILKYFPDEFISDNAKLIGELGYWKDLLQYFDNTGVVKVFAYAVATRDRLACKWAPRKGDNARKLRDMLGWTNRHYRKHIKNHSFTVEQEMTDNKWTEINYSSVPGKAMPTMLMVLSDMQFDNASETGQPHFDIIKQRFADAGYKMPKLVFWNLLSSECKGSPATANDTDVAMVSGFNPILMKAILAVEDFNPVEVMTEALKGITINIDNLPNKIEAQQHNIP